MKRHGSSDSMTGFIIPMCHNIDESISTSPVGYTREFHQSMLMDEGDDECAGGGQIIFEKKRRLSVDQVKALEKNFEMDNKLEPDRKVKLAQELSLQPRQVAVWFQNRRARWKTKQLERDYGLLQAKFDSLQHNYEATKQDNESLVKQIRELKFKLYDEDEESNNPMKKEESRDISKSLEMYDSMVATTYFKDGSSDSDSSAILNEDNNMAAVANGHQINESKEIADESCNFFSDDQAPTLQWYCQDQWNLTKEN